MHKVCNSMFSKNGKIYVLLMKVIVKVHLSTDWYICDTYIVVLRYQCELIWTNVRYRLGIQNARCLVCLAILQAAVVR